MMYPEPNAILGPSSGAPSAALVPGLFTAGVGGRTVNTRTTAGETLATIAAIGSRSANAKLTCGTAQTNNSSGIAAQITHSRLTAIKYFRCVMENSRGYICANI